MAVPAIDATPSGLSSNSYVTLTEAVEYLEMRPGGQEFTALDVERQRAALLFAVVLIERETFWGYKVDLDQALEFPRGRDVLIPEKVRHAQIEQALDIANGGFIQRENFLESQSLGIRQLSSDDTLSRFLPSTPMAIASKGLAPATLRLLSGYTEWNVMLGRA